MIHERTTSRHLLVLLAALTLALAAPAAAQETGKLVVQPGETIAIGADQLVLDLINLRNQDTLNPITELRQYRDDDPRKQITRVIGVPNDDYFKINTYTLHRKYGRYFPYSAADGLIERNSITFVHASTPTPTETIVTVTETPTETPPATTTATPTQAPLPGLIAIAALGICGLLGAKRR